MGLVAAGKASLPAMSQAEARDMLRGKKVAKLPAKAKARKQA